MLCRILRTLPEADESGKLISGAALSSWHIEPQGLHKQNKTWGSLEIFRLLEHSRGSLLVSVSQKLRTDQHSLRVSNSSATYDQTKQPTTTLFVVAFRPLDHRDHYPRAGLSIAGAAQALD